MAHTARWLLAGSAAVLAVAATTVDTYKCARQSDVPPEKGGGCAWWVADDVVLAGGSGVCQSWRLTKPRVGDPSLSCEHWLRVTP